MSESKEKSITQNNKENIIKIKSSNNTSNDGRICYFIAKDSNKTHNKRKKSEK